MGRFISAIASKAMLGIGCALGIALGTIGVGVNGADAATLAFNNIPGPSDPASELNFVDSQIGFDGPVHVLGKLNFGPKEGGLYSSNANDVDSKGIISDVGAEVDGVVEFILSNVTIEGGKVTTFDLSLERPIVYDLVAVFVKAGSGGTIWYDGEFSGISALNTVGRKGNTPDISHITVFGSVIPVPVPAAMPLMVLALAGLFFVAHRRKKMAY